jgi:molybdenum cofactor cytidylyltransferase
LPSGKTQLAVGDFEFAVVILGAGRSSRMGRPKLLLPWGTTTVLGHLIRQWTDAGAAQIALVRAAQDEVLDKERLRAGASTDSVINPSPERGMFSSIQCAAQWSGWKVSVTHWVIALGDQPHLRCDTLKRLVETVREEPRAVWQPARNGRPRHPVVLPKSAFERLRTFGVLDLKEFLNSAPETRRTVAVNDEGLDLDIDTPEDYERAKRIAGLA